MDPSLKKKRKKKEIPKKDFVITAENTFNGHESVLGGTMPNKFIMLHHTSPGPVKTNLY